MTSQQLHLAIGIPTLFNAGLVGILLAYMNVRFNAVEQSMNQRFAAIDKRFDDLRDLWRADLRGVEEVLDARLKHRQER